MEVVPEPLRVGREAPARHLPHLARQGHVVAVLRDRHRDGEVHRIAAARDQPRRPERRVDALPAPARVFLALVTHEAEGALDDVDLLRLLVLARHLAEPAAALRAGPVGHVERVDDLDLGQRELGARAMARPWRRRRIPRPVARPRAPFRRRAKQRAGPRGELLLNCRELELEGGDGVFPPGVRELFGELGEPRIEPVELGALQQGHLAQALDVGLGLDPDHAALLAHAKLECKSHRGRSPDRLPRRQRHGVRHESGRGELHAFQGA